MTFGRTLAKTEVINNDYYHSGFYVVYCWFIFNWGCSVMKVFVGFLLGLVIAVACLYLSTTECYTINTDQDNQVFICEWN